MGLATLASVPPPPDAKRGDLDAALALTRILLPIEREQGDRLESERLARRWFAAVREAGSTISATSFTMTSFSSPSCDPASSSKEGGLRPLRRGEPRPEPLRGYGRLFQPIDDERVVVEGRMRWIDDDRVIRDDPVIWAMEFRDGLLARFVPARTRVEAETILGRSAT